MSPTRRLAVLATLLTTSCDRASEPSYTPGLGEIMTLTQMRHCKLWFAGDAQNWALASYELGELEEGFADAVTFHPQHKDAPEPLTALVPRFTTLPVAALRDAIDAHDPQRFTAAFSSLTAACNGCHIAAKFACNVVVQPRANPFGNQDFTAHDH